MADTAKRLAGPSAGTGSEATLYTVPGSTVTTIKRIRIVNSNAAAQVCKMSIGADATGTRLLPANTSVPGAGWIDISDWTVLAAAETLRWTGHADLTITVSGVEST